MEFPAVGARMAAPRMASFTSAGMSFCSNTRTDLRFINTSIVSFIGCSSSGPQRACAISTTITRYLRVKKAGTSIFFRNPFPNGEKWGIITLKKWKAPAF